MQRVSYVLFALLGACGARSEITGSNLDGDASLVGFDASLGDAFFHGDAHDGLDGGADVATCTAVTVGIGCAGPTGQDCSDCKFDVEWSCGDTKYRIGGSCDPPGSGPQGGFYQGVCDENGQQTSTFDTPTTTCDCTDASALITIVQPKCTHQ